MASRRHRKIQKLRRQAHAAFDPIWQSGRKSRTKAYRRLAFELGRPIQETHMSRMDEAALQRVIEVCTNLREC